MASTSQPSQASPSSSSSPKKLAPMFVKRTSNKRIRDAAEDSEHHTRSNQGTALKQTKIAAIFAPKQQPVSINADASVNSTRGGRHTFTWLPTNPCFLLHGLYGPPVFSSKLACFDIDGTLIRTKSGGSFPNSQFDWVFWCNKGTVQERLREYHAKGYSVIFVSNQCYQPHHKPHQNFKSKLPLIAKDLTDVPFRVFAGTSKDNNFRKPDIGIWRLLESTFAAQNITLDKEASFYVGDAAGRPGINGKRGDHSSCDKEWAKNIGIPFYTPEEFFWERKDCANAGVQLPEDGEGTGFAAGAGAGAGGGQTYAGVAKA